MFNKNGTFDMRGGSRFLSLLKNSRGDVVEHGVVNESGGFTKLPASEIWYCGKFHNECRCGECNRICGPNKGCPCESCYQLLLLENNGTKYKLNRLGNIARRGRNEGHGGYTPFLPSELWYCGQRREDPCRCGRCNDDIENGGGVCGPSSGCPCSACLGILLEQNVARLRLNIENGREEQIVMMKGKRSGTAYENTVCNGLFRADELWYCGRRVGGGEICSADNRNGRPCDNCLQVLIDEGQARIRSDGTLLRRGAGNLATNEVSSSSSAHSTFVHIFDPDELWYCGQQLDECRCGPTNGRPCDSCLDVLIQEGMAKRNNLGHLCRKGTNMSEREDEKVPQTPFLPSELWYCGRRNDDCRCGNCDGICGPRRGCPCRTCLETVISEGRAKYNGAGKLARRGGNSGSGGFLEIPPSQIWYCGELERECLCRRCTNDARCGPNEGCPCSACFELVKQEPQFGYSTIRNILRRSLTSGTSSSRVAGEASESSRSSRRVHTREADEVETTSENGVDSRHQDDGRPLCSICYDNRIDAVYIPCGHCFCWSCTQKDTECPSCRRSGVHYRIFIP